MRLRLLITLTLALCARASLGQQPATQTPTFRTGIDLVELDVRVTDASGSFVPGLTEKDFEILEDGQPQTVAALSLDRAMRQGIRFVSEFSLPPGRHQLRVAAGGLTGVAGSVTSDLEIPDFREAPLEMSALSLASPKASEVVTQMVTNRLQGALPGPPAALREFTSGDVVAIYAEAYPGRRTAPNSISMQVTLRDGNGRVLRLVDAQRAASAGQRSNGSGFVAEMALRDVPVGAYVVHVEARADAKTSVSREIPIRVH